jgi:hypothetical protein
LVVSRRALLGSAGGALLLAGCGPPEERKVDARKVWEEQLRASQEALMAYPDGDALRKDAGQRTLLIGAALERAGGVFHDATQRTAGSPLAAEQAALRAHVAAVGLLEDRRSREVLVEVIAGSAAAQSALLARQDKLISASFPGHPPNPR